MNLVTLRDVGVAYDGYEALQHVDLEIADNDFLGVGWFGSIFLSGNLII